MQLRLVLVCLCVLSLQRMISSWLRRMSIPTTNVFRRAASSRVASSELAHDSYKRKLAVVISYVGSNYHGIQYQPSTGVRTIEGELRRALYEIGAILPTNDMDKISWSRSSRTDKGVHASRLIVSAKFEILPSWLPQFDGPPEEVAVKHTDYLHSDMVRIKPFVEALNSKLPEDIRAMSCVKVNKSFLAREACMWREYEYVLPAEILNHPIIHNPDALAASAHLAHIDRYHGYDPSTLDTKEALNRLNAALAQFLGTQTFQNFNNMRRKELDEILDGSYARKKNKKAALRVRRNGGDELDLESSGEEGEAVAEEEGMNPLSAAFAAATSLDGTTDTSASSTAAATPASAQDITTAAGVVSSLSSGNRVWTWVNFNDEWTAVDRPIIDKFRNRIYHMQARLIKAPDGRELVGITIRGSAFLLNQIRLMIGAALLVARGVIPPDSIAAALQLPCKFFFPMVPAEGLYLKYAGFGRNGDRNFALSSIGAYDVHEDVLLMDDVEYATSEEFARTRIQPRIQQDWYENNAALLTEWLQKSERYRPPRTVADTWVSLYAEQVRRIQEDLPARRETELRRVTEAIAAFERNVPIYDTLVASKNHYIVAKHRNEEQRRSGSPHTAAAAENERHRIRHRHVPAPETFKHNSFLPSRFATELVVRSGELPGLKVDQGLRAIAFAVAEGSIRPDMTCEELLAYALGEGRTVEYWAYQRPKHEIIR